MNILKGKLLCERIRSLRKSQNWSQDFLSERAGLQQSRLSRLEVDPKRWPLTVEEAEKLADAFGLTITEFLKPGDVTVKPKTIVSGTKGE